MAIRLGGVAWLAGSHGLAYGENRYLAALMAGLL